MTAKLLSFAMASALKAVARMKGDSLFLAPDPSSKDAANGHQINSAEDEEDLGWKPPRR